jgi:polyferredoxin
MLDRKSKIKKKKKINFKRNRKIIRIKDKFRLFGVSMTIGIISVPVGSILVGKYFGKNKKAIPTLIAASFIWSFGITYITAFIVGFIKPLFS